MLCKSMFSDEQLSAIGCLALEATRLESFVDVYIEFECGEKIATLLLKQNKMAAGKLAVFRSLVLPDIASEELRKEFENWYSTVTTDIERRNTVIHGEWEFTGDGIPLRDILKLMMERTNDVAARKKNGETIVKANEVMDLARRFAAHQKNLIRLMAKIRPSSLERQI